MRKTLSIVLIVLLPFWACRALPEKNNPSRPIAENNEITTTIPETATTAINKNTPIHYTGRYCEACHEKAPVKGGDIYLKYNGNYRRLCWCHDGMSPGYCHPLEINSEQGKKMNIPADLPLENGKFTCNSCHDVYLQCQKQLFKRNSLRGAPYPLRSDFCFRCHDKDHYKKLNVHHEIDPDGKLVIKTCLYCHEKKPDEKIASYKEVTFIGDIKVLCRRCHQIQGNHAGNFDHMAVKPSPEGLNRMKAMKKKYNIILPLAKDGKMTCITCHNPHEKGVIPGDKPSAKGADSKYRLRLPEKMCKECHQM